MEFIDLKAQYKHLKCEIDEAVLKVLARGDYILGEEVKLLEAELAAYVGTKYCVTCANGTDALTLALRALGIGAGDAVFLPDFTFFATAETVTGADATPVFVDVDPHTFNLDPNKLSDAVARVKKEKKYRPKAVIPVDLFGLPCDYSAIQKIAQNENLLILEDGAQGFGGEFRNEKVCSFGDIATTSFFPAKPLGCYGDGGALFTSDDEYYKQLLSLRFHGKGDDKYDNIRIGWNSRLDTVQAAILLIKLRAFRKFELVQRHRVAKAYSDLLQDRVQTPLIPDGFSSSYAQYTIVLTSTAERARLIAQLKSDDIPAMIYYPKCMHEQTAYAHNPCVYYDVTNAAALTGKVLSLPMHPYLADADIERIVSSIKRGLDS